MTSTPSCAMLFDASPTALVSQYLAVGLLLTVLMDKLVGHDRPFDAESWFCVVLWPVAYGAALWCVVWTLLARFFADLGGDHEPWRTVPLREKEKAARRAAQEASRYRLTNPNLTRAAVEVVVERGMRHVAEAATRVRLVLPFRFDLRTRGDGVRVQAMTYSLGSLPFEGHLAAEALDFMIETFIDRTGHYPETIHVPASFWRSVKQHFNMMPGAWAASSSTSRRNSYRGVEISPESMLTLTAAAVMVDPEVS